MDHFTTTDGVRLAYSIDDFTDPWRPSQPLILLHSAMSCMERLRTWMPRLVRHFRVIRMDLRGHGQSEVPGPDSELTIDRLIEDIRELMALAEVPAAHFVGTSAGGYLSMRMAMDHPDAVRSLSLFGSTPGFKGGQAQAWLPRIRTEGLRNFLADTITDRFPKDMIDTDRVNWFLDQAGSTEPKFLERFILLMDGQDWSDELHKITCPTLLVVPGAGKIGDYSGFDRMKESISRVDLRVYENMPHNVWDSQPERCVEDTLDFLGNEGFLEPQGTAANLSAQSKETVA
ncbi:haloacetate dehalogenase H-1 (plasmid) [Antarctobacter heliothermus]|uniref:Haloacetate dehalogenase H-1 n=1 Tax=Antarctobacter heliothermus TaxID=74033 RepID=A0A222EBI1_9RHOB|nr:alpha/beta hydrolase [Antarctobacter heliothermus]ASP23545.1 haloacetate dehalogenase H-1 [Antarctobacter heliothermus]